jgi:uncharacterized protein YjlB
MKAVETRPVAVVGGSDGNAVLAGAGDVVLQLIGGGKVRTTLKFGAIAHRATAHQGGAMAVAEWPNPTEEGRFWLPEPAKWS